MSNRLLVATRKGLFSLRKQAAWAVESVDFVGDPVTVVLRDPRDRALYAALNLGHFGVKTHRSDDDGATWTEVGAPAFPRAEDAASGPSVKQTWALAAGGASQPGRIWAGTIPGALFRSDDRGISWALVESLWDRPERDLWFGGGADEPGIHSICVDPRDPRRVVVGVSCGGVWETRDDGATWAQRAHGMVADFMPPARQLDPEIQDPHCVVQCPGQPETWWAQHHNGIFRSTDDLGSWHRVETAVPSAFGFPVAVHPQDPDVAWFVPAVKDECRVPVDGAVVVSRTRDGGQTFTVLREGLPQQHAYDLIYRHALDIDATGERLAMGSTTGNLWVTETAGERWISVSTHLPPIYAIRFA